MTERVPNKGIGRMNVGNRRIPAVSQRLQALIAVATVIVAWSATVSNATASATFSEWDGALPANPAGDAYTQAGGHPYQSETNIAWPMHPNLDFPGGFSPDEDVKDILAEVPAGLMANPTAVSTCTSDQVRSLSDPTADRSDWCPIASQIGVVYLGVAGIFEAPLPLFNMKPPTGVTARFSFNIAGYVINIDGAVRGQGTDLNLGVDSTSISQAVALTSTRVIFWGVPAASVHDGDRCFKPSNTGVSPHLCSGEPGADGGPNPAGVGALPFLTMPTSCSGPGVGLRFDGAIDSWLNPGSFGHATFFTHEPTPNESVQRGSENCGVVPSNVGITAQPTIRSAESPTGLNVSLDIPTAGVLNPTGVSQSHIKKVVVSLPEGVTINPSQGEGLGVCTRAQYASENIASTTATGCPPSSKIGTVSVGTPLLAETLEGSIYIAASDDPATALPGAENPFDSLVALYIVIKNRDRGVMIKLAGKVEPDGKTGQVVTTFDDLPQVTFSNFTLHFREGQRSPLATPRTCGTYRTEARFTPWSAPNTEVTAKSSFEIVQGVGGSACPSGGMAPFAPKLSAGSLNNNALSYSPFNVRMTREDGEQEITRFSADLPPGLAAKLAGVPKCSDADLAATAKASGATAIVGSICPAASQVGRVRAGYGVGSVLTSATGKVFLAGPYQGAPVSIATVVPAVVGPFDLGTIVQRSAFTVDPETAEVHVDSRASDPIPHILKGFELHLRDIRVYMDRPGFTFNPTSCDKSKVGAFLDGSGMNFFSSADDPRVDVTNPFQAANCSLLPFKPKLSFKLKGGTKRGDFPALRATLKGRPGDANLGKVVVALPKSEFLEQGHIGTVCTRVQFAASNCPAASIYGNATATTPLLDKPLSGPVYLRSSNNQLPDLVIALRGEIAVNAVGRIDSVNGGIRSTFATIPDTPIDTFTLRMQGGKKGLLVNSRNLCLKPARADVTLTGQNGKVLRAKPKMGVRCGKDRKRDK